MVKAEGSWLFPPLSTWQSPNFYRMTTSLDPAQLQCLPACMNPGTFMTSANMSMPGFAVPSIPDFETQQSNEAYGLPQCSPPHSQNFLPGTNPYVKENLSMFSYGLGRGGVANPILGCQRRFFVFDQSGNEKRLIYSSCGLAVPKPATADAKPIPSYFNNKEYAAAKMDQMKLKLHEVSDENHFSGKETEMHEDTEEINALLDSDDDDYDEDDRGSDDDDGGDDEVRSTGHFPILIKSHGTQEQVDEITEEVSSSDGPNKRQKLIDGGYKKSSPVDTASSVKVERYLGYDSDMESSHAIGETQKEGMVSIFGSKQFRKDKIHATLKILESIIPGAKNKEPLLVLDEAINYLKSLKLKAKTLGVNFH